jgi:hypothetical protein
MDRLKPISRFAGDVKEGDLVRVIFKNKQTVVGYNGKGKKMVTFEGDKYRASVYMFSGVRDEEYERLGINPCGLAMPRMAGTSCSPVNIFTEGKSAEEIRGYEVLRRR